MKRIFLILRLLLEVKFIFKSPQKYELVVFDDDAIYDLKNFINSYNYFILETVNPIADVTKTSHKVYLSFKLLKYFFKNYKGNIKTAYMVSLLEIINPKVVLTTIDNSYKFSDVARILDQKMTFIAIQNAARIDIHETKYLYGKKKIESDFTEKLYIPNFLCFGQYEIDQYRGYKIKVKNFFKIGSLRLANFLHHIKKNNIEPKKIIYDICLVSEQKNFIEENIEKGFSYTAKFTIKFCMKHNMKLIWACKRDKKITPQKYNLELDYYKKHLTDNEFKYLIDNSREKKIFDFTSYMSMIQSKVAVGNVSTLLRENLGMGRKILSLNSTGLNVYDFPIQGICSMQNCTFEEFEKRLLQIISMSEKDYFSQLNRDKSYVAEFSEENSTIEKIKNKIDFFLNDQSSPKN